MIDWSQVEVGDVVEYRGGSREKIESFMLTTNGEPHPVYINEWSYGIDGRDVYGEDSGSDIVAIHKPGTVGALSHEERSRLWDKAHEYRIQITIMRDYITAYQADPFGAVAHGQSQLEAVMKCVAAIEAQQKESANG